MDRILAQAERITFEVLPQERINAPGENIRDPCDIQPIEPSSQTPTDISHSTSLIPVQLPMADPFKSMPMVQRDPELYADDLEILKRRLLEHVLEAGKVDLNIAQEIFRIYDSELYRDEGFWSFPQYLEYCGGRLNLGERTVERYKSAGQALELFYCTTFRSTWKLSDEFLASNFDKLTFFMSALKNRKLIDEIMKNFIALGARQFRAWATGYSDLDKAEREAIREKRRSRSARLAAAGEASSEREKRLVRILKRHEKPVGLGIRSVEDVPDIDRALLGYRLLNLSFDRYSGTLPEVLPEIPYRIIHELRTLEDAERCIRLHLEEGTPHHVSIAIVFARLADSEALKKQWAELGYGSHYAYIEEHLKIGRDPWRYTEIGRNYLKYEGSLLGFVDLSVPGSLTKLYSLDRAIVTHDGKFETVVKALVELDGEEFKVFSGEKDYWTKKRSDEGPLKLTSKARSELFIINGLQAREDASVRRYEGIEGPIIWPFGIISEGEERFLRKALHSPEYVLPRYLGVYMKMLAKVDDMT